MANNDRTPSAAPYTDNAAAVPDSWRRLVAVALLSGAVRRTGSLLTGFVVTWWQHD
ncbi:hypothetical protein HCJ76_00170 [Streptomyces sp. MC1]|uniref:hypothetical protein n=1 Tax=Streptomyces TaxID=1883 RepID=UPI0018CA9FDC|nr:hypothetical protein [Streptomyces sp. MC1]MBG7696561.1 hypothetical protein [Streptomyces sp. MC1]